MSFNKASIPPFSKAPFQVKVKLGYHFNCQHEKTSVTFSVAEIIIHPHYVHSPEQMDNDIALLKLSSAVHFNHEISPICLPKRGEFTEDVFILIN